MKTLKQIREAVYTTGPDIYDKIRVGDTVKNKEGKIAASPEHEERIALDNGVASYKDGVLKITKSETPFNPEKLHRTYLDAKEAEALYHHLHKHFGSK